MSANPATRDWLMSRRWFPVAPTLLFLWIIAQIDKANVSLFIADAGATIADMVFQARFFDQAHLTRSLKHLIGDTPATVMNGDAQLSFLYNTSAPEWLYDSDRDFGARNEK